mmetsp:Transcript_29115/g.57063  ORF Transcript_29115/g.57063 Transcript_29115/m.57063 type:complete len:116 (-) Transcript_29115:912-1259(-)
MTDTIMRFPLAVIHIVAMGERWGYSCSFHRQVGGIPFTLIFRRAPPGWRVGDTAVVSMPGLSPARLQDTFAPLSCSMQGMILDPSGARVLRLPGTVRKMHSRAPSRGRKIKNPGG